MTPDSESVFDPIQKGVDLKIGTGVETRVVRVCVRSENTLLSCKQPDSDGTNTQDLRTR